MKRNAPGTGRTVAAMIAVFSSLTTLPAQTRDQLLLAVSSADGTLSISKVERTSLTPLATVPVGKGSRQEVCVSPDGRRAYVSNDKDNSTTAVDLERREVIATILLPGIKRAEGCAESPDGKKLYVAGMESNNIAIVSVPEHKLSKTIEMGKEPRRFLFTPDGRRVYVTSEDGPTIRILDVMSDKVVGSFESGGEGPRILVALPDQKTLLAANVDSDTASFIDIGTRKPVHTIGVGASPQRVAISPDGAKAYILSVAGRMISVVELKGPQLRALKYAHTGASPYGMAMSDDGSRLFISEPAENRIVAFDTSAINALKFGAAYTEQTAAVQVPINRPTGIVIRRAQ